MNDIQKLHYWTFKILPLVYDDSLSYYEVLAKVTNKLNEIVENVNEIPSDITTEISNQLNNTYATNIAASVKEQVDALTEESQQTIENLATTTKEEINTLANSVITGIVKAIATDEGTATYTASAKTGGELIWLNNTLYEVVAPMAVGTKYVVGSNISEVVLSDYLNHMKGYLSDNNEFYAERSSHEYDTGVYLYWKDNLYITTADIKVNDILYDGGDSQNLKEVTLGEEIASHYLEMHNADNNLQTQIDGNDGDIENLQTALASETSRATNRENSIDNRISNIVSQSGDDNTEIVDARKWVDKLGGASSTTLGDALRGQINDARTVYPWFDYTNSDGKLDLDELRGVNQDFYLYTPSNLVNTPEDYQKEGVSLLEVRTSAGLSYTDQILHAGPNPTYRIQSWSRNYYQGVWGEWEKINDPTILNATKIYPKFNTPNSGDDFDFDLVTATNTSYYFNLVFSGNLLNAPDGFALTGATSVLEVSTSLFQNTAWTAQILRDNIAATGKWYSRFKLGTQEWSEWEMHTNDSENEITIGTNGNYQTLREGITYAYNNSTKNNPITVYVQPGTYDLMNEFSDSINTTSLASTVGIPLGNYIHVIFNAGTYVTAIYESTGDTTLDALVAQNFNPFYNAGSDFTIENLNITAQDTRYCVHDERSGSGTYNANYINCTMKYTRHNATNQWYVQCIGGGLGEHGHILVDGGYYETIDEINQVLQPISYHNGYNSAANSTLFFKNVCLGNNGYFRLGCYGPSTTVSQCYVSGCKMARDVYVMFENDTAMIKNFAVTAWNNEVTNTSNNTTESITGDRS